MPIYEYYCSKCEKIFEELIIGAPKGVKCPSCGNRRVRKALSVFGMKSGSKFVSSSGSGSSCSSCGGGDCSTCR